MLDLIARLLLAMSVAIGGGVATAGDHASPNPNQNAFDAIEALISEVAASVERAQPTDAGQPATTGLDRANEVADDHAADGLGTAAEAAGDHPSKPADAGAAAEPHQIEAPPVGAPPVDTPPVSGPPEAAPPVPAPPVPAPPVDAPGVGNRP